MGPTQRPEDDSLRTLVYAFLLTIYCLYIFRLRKRPRVAELITHTHIDDTGRQDTALAQGVKGPSVDALYQIDAPRGHISSLAFLADGKRMRRPRRGGATDDLDVPLNVIASSKDGKIIVTGDKAGKVMIWDTSDQKPCETAERHGRLITALDVSSEHIASGSEDGTVVVWKMGKPGLPPEWSRSMRHGLVAVSSVKFSPAGSRIASACADWGSDVRTWHTRTGDQIRSIHVGGSPIYSLTWSSDGRQLFIGRSHGSISRFDLVTQESSKVVENRLGDDSITSLHISNSGQFLVSFSSPGQTVDVWDIRDTLACEPLRSYSQCVAASVSPDDLYLASCGDDARISILSLPKFLEPSFFFLRLAPLLHHSEPFTYISLAAYIACKLGEPERAEHILSRGIEDKRYPDFDCYSHANRALVRIRRGDLNGALDDAAKIVTNGAGIPLIVHVAKAMALIAQGKRKEARDALGSVDQGDAKHFVDCVESIFLFEAELRDKLNWGTELAGPSPLEDANSCSWVKTRKLLLLAEHCMQRKEYDEGLRLLAKTPDPTLLLHIPETETIPLVFGWDVYDLAFMVKQLICVALFTSGRTREVEYFLQVNKEQLDEEHESRKAELGWLSEKLGDEAMRQRKYDDAITWYSKSLDLCPESRVNDCGSEFSKKCLSAIKVNNDVADGTISGELDLIAHYPPSPARLLVKRSKAKAFRGLCHGALEDANQAINLDQSCLWGYERRYVALYALGRARGADKTLKEMVMKMEESPDPCIHQLLTKYNEMISKINEQIKSVHERSPLILIHVGSGRLCDAAKRAQIFKATLTFHGLVLSMAMATKLDTDHIKKVVTTYFRYVMFSHTWEGDEPTFQEVSGKTVYELNPLFPLKLKLRHFCEMVRDDPESFLWAWSDTCCIDKSNATDFQRSLRSMYNWYKGSALTIVLLAEGSTTLKYNKWMTRAWTLQELLSPKAIRFYNRDWTLYQGNTRSNHKQSSGIIQELAEAIHVSQDALVDFSPKSLTVRVRLHLASTRKATVKVDIAYALIGIFDSTLVPDPGQPEPEVALGRLLQGIVHREQDIKAVLDWVGKSSQFNSCLPAEISAYQDLPHTSLSISANDMEARVAELRNSLPRRDVTRFFKKLTELNKVAFSKGRLSLPCITFSTLVDTVSQVQVAALGQVSLKTSCSMLTVRDKVVLVYPWILDLLDERNTSAQDDYTRGLRLVVHLEQSFSALLLLKQPADTYKRVAADQEIRIPKRKVMSLKGISAEVLEIR
ncbi:hypothetical protein EV363DRAFT_1381394 [Boletus edulis]|nr:hypothetical protein EV363DRAFT_1381394 [Boletus edulis]